MNTQVNGEDHGFDFGDPAFNDTEQQIMDGVEPPSDEPQDTDATPPAQQQTPTEPASAGDDADTDKARQSGEGEPPAQQQPAQTQQRSDRPNADNKGNLVDGQGNVIAAAGRERRIFENNERLVKQNRSLNQELTALRQSNEQVQQLMAQPAQLGLTPQDVQAAYQIMGEFKKNPMSVAQWALKETLAMGYNLQQIVGEGEGSIEMQAIAKMIDNRVGPVVDKQQQTQQNIAAQQAAMREYNTFIQTHEHALVHEDALAQLLERSPGLTPDGAYWRLHSYAQQHGLDFSQPLGPQIAAKQQAAQQQPAPQGQPATPPAQQRPVQSSAAPMPNGASPTNQQQSAQPMFADPNTEWDDIIGQSMRDAGMN